MPKGQFKRKKISLNLEEVYFIMESLEMRSYKDIFSNFENNNRNGFTRLIGKLQHIKYKLDKIEVRRLDWQNKRRTKHST
ncbi:MAG TPA: hypothetical protein VMZ91_02710 [Candidatus Paceibacterota bacterium]|nr:hypothetical protein [Candidatus Paceibacterota bacterium]